jgi:uncharacterized protein (TIGR02118 family)
VIRRISFTRRAAGVGYDDFQRHWRGPHAELARLLPDLRSYVQNHAVLGPEGPLLPYPGFDVCVELEYDSREDMEASLTSPEYRGAAIADQSGFTDMTHLMWMLVESPGVAQDPARPDAVKHMTFIRRTGAVESEQFEEAVLGPYADVIGEATDGRRRELLLPSSGMRAGDPPPAFDAVDIVWFDNAGAAVAFTTSGVAQRARWELGGRAAGIERLIARGLRVI